MGRGFLHIGAVGVGVRHAPYQLGNRLAVAKPRGQLHNAAVGAVHFHLAHVGGQNQLGGHAIGSDNLHGLVIHIGGGGSISVRYLKGVRGHIGKGEASAGLQGQGCLIFLRGDKHAAALTGPRDAFYRVLAGHAGQAPGGLLADNRAGNAGDVEIGGLIGAGAKAGDHPGLAGVVVHSGIFFAAATQSQLGFRIIRTHQPIAIGHRQIHNRFILGTAPVMVVFIHYGSMVAVFQAPHNVSGPVFPAGCLVIFIPFHRQTAAGAGLGRCTCGGSGNIHLQVKAVGIGIPVGSRIQLMFVVINVVAGAAYLFGNHAQTARIGRIGNLTAIAHIGPVTVIAGRLPHIHDLVAGLAGIQIRAEGIAHTGLSVLRVVSLGNVVNADGVNLRRADHRVGPGAVGLAGVVARADDPHTNRLAHIRGLDGIGILACTGFHTGIDAPHKGQLGYIRVGGGHLSGQRIAHHRGGVVQLNGGNVLVVQDFAAQVAADGAAVHTRAGGYHIYLLANPGLVQGQRPGGSAGNGGAILQIPLVGSVRAAGGQLRPNRAAAKGGTRHGHAAQHGAGHTVGMGVYRAGIGRNAAYLYFHILAQVAAFHLIAGGIGHLFAAHIPGHGDGGVFRHNGDGQHIAHNGGFLANRNGLHFILADNAGLSGHHGAAKEIADAGDLQLNGLAHIVRLHRIGGVGAHQRAAHAPGVIHRGGRRLNIGAEHIAHNGVGLAQGYSAHIGIILHLFGLGVGGAGIAAGALYIQGNHFALVLGQYVKGRTGGLLHAFHLPAVGNGCLGGVHPGFQHVARVGVGIVDADALYHQRNGSGSRAKIQKLRHHIADAAANGNMAPLIALLQNGYLGAGLIQRQPLAARRGAQPYPQAVAAGNGGGGAAGAGIGRRYAGGAKNQIYILHPSGEPANGNLGPLAAALQHGYRGVYRVFGNHVIVLARAFAHTHAIPVGTGDGGIAAGGGIRHSASAYQ